MVEDARSGTEVSRRGFVGWAMGLGAGFVGIVVGVPLIGALVEPSQPATPGEYVQVADVSAIPVGEPFGISFAEQTTDAYNVTLLPHSVYALKKSDTEIVVYSPVCPHLGCQVYFDRQLNEYVCPCHGSKFAVDGAKISGPTPRGLDTLPSKIEKGALYVQWVQYKPGIPEKTPV
jgi:quinol---cytochrome c reductase iron-sulfur subunit, bacillus type